MLYQLAIPEADLIIPFEELVDRCFAALSDTGHFSPTECPLVHRFTPGPKNSGMQMYIREIFMPAGCTVVSERHETEHPYTVSQGCLSVRTENEIVVIAAPHTGITSPGTQRILYMHADTVWTTYHIVPDTMTDPEEIKASIIAPRRPNPYLLPPTEAQEELPE